jgi:hypothetical protein
MAVGTKWKLLFTALYLAVFASQVPWLCGQMLHKTELFGTDFTIFWAGWSLVLEGRARELYDLAAQREVQHAIMHGVEFPGGIVPFLHPPHAALVMAPLALLPRTAATWLWTAIQIALLARFARSLSARAASRADRWLLVAALLAYPAVFASLQFGQLAVLLTVALVELVAAVEEGRDGAAVVCLVLLSFKPHLLLTPLAILVARRRWRLLARFAAAMGALAVVTMAVLGPRIYLDYLAALPRLEQFWGKSGPHFMVNLRGTLLRLAVPGRVVDVATAAGMIAAALVAYELARRQVRRGALEADAWPPALALGLFFNPHLFLHDALLWVVPLALFHASLQRRGRDAAPFAAFALAWPLAGIVNWIAEDHDVLLPVHLLVVAATVATVWIVREARGRAAPMPAAS